jgi:predicted transcriptional regulator of viral defense system
MKRHFNYVETYLDELQGKGKYTFVSAEMPAIFNVTENAIKKVLQRLKGQKKISLVRKGFYVIVPPEYRVKGIFPSSFYVHDLMKFLNRDYYVGLQNAAAYYGAAHQQPQSFSIITQGIPLRSIKSDLIAIDFYHKKIWLNEFVTQRKSNTGYFNISSAELTALDLIKFYKEVGGFNRVVNMIEDLVEVMNPEQLLYLAHSYHDIAVVQRLGYLLEFVLNEVILSAVLQNYLLTVSHYPVLLRPSNIKPQKMKTGNHWKVVVNIEIDIEL